MPFLASHASGEAVNIYYEDLGKGKPIVLIHGWPLSGSMWEYQVTGLLDEGYRVITYDRRGFGKSDYPATGYDYETLAGDLQSLIAHLNLTDATLVGFSMGGGEIAKYFGKHGGAGVIKTVLISSVLPFMLKTSDNEDGIPQDIFDAMGHGMKTDRPSFLADFTKNFYSVGFINKPISDAYINVAVNNAMNSSPVATLACANSFATTDFRADVVKINVPTFIIHGTEDKIVPIEASSDKTAKLLPAAQYKKYDGAPHGLWFTSQKELLNDLVEFIK